jgi:hypothetical protein
MPIAGTTTVPGSHAATVQGSHVPAPRAHAGGKWSGTAAAPPTSRVAAAPTTSHVTSTSTSATASVTVSDG